MSTFCVILQKTYVLKTKGGISVKISRRIITFVLGVWLVIVQIQPTFASEAITTAGYQLIYNDLALNEAGQLVSADTTTEQKWMITLDESGAFSIQNIATGQYIHLENKKVSLSDEASLWKYVDGNIVSNDNENLYLTIKNDKLTVKKKSSDWTLTRVSTWSGAVLSASAGVVQGPSGKESYYNLDMSGVVSNMKSLGYDYEYWVREDGAKMYGDYVMVAADLNTRPIGTILETSLGLGIVCDTGSFAATDPTQLDVATNW